MLDEAIATARETGGPVAARDVALLELLYSTGIRVSELCGLDVDDLDRQRSVIGCSARAARNEPCLSVCRPCVRSRLGSRAARPQLITGDSGQAMFLGERGKRIDPRVVRRIVHRSLR